MADEIWINTGLVDNTYRPVIVFGEGDELPLDIETALTYAMEMLRAVATAEHEAAVYAQLSKISIQAGDPDKAQELAGMVIAGLRDDRPEPVSTVPLRLVPGVSAFTGKAFLSIEIRGKAVGQWTAEDARDHALTMLMLTIVADLDSAYLRALRALIGLDLDTATAVVNDLQNFRDA